DDLERWLRGAPVWAHPHNFLYRARKRLVRRRRWVAAGAALAGLLAGGWLVLADRGAAVPGGEWARRHIDRHELSVQRPAPTVEELRAAAARQRTELADHALHRAGRSGAWLSGHMRAGAPFDRADAWSQVQGTACLLAVPEVPAEDLRPLVAVLHTDLFGPNPFYRPFDPKHGWPHFYDNLPAMEGCGWALTAIPAALSRPELVTPAERALLLQRLDQIQTVIDQCRLRDPQTGRETGAYKMVAQTIGRPPSANAYTTLLVYQGLIELSRLGLPWRGDAARREELFRATHAALLEQFDGKGWRTTGRSQGDFNDGLTLQLFALLLRAERYGLAELPPAVADQIPRHLAECRTRPFDHPISLTVFEAEAAGFAGERLVIQRPVRFLWHPWAIECAARWLARLQRRGAPNEDVVAARRVLGHLVLALGPVAAEELKAGYAFVLLETVYGLSAAADLP
ncbi:MAG: hypothetical protein J0I06_19395, partial [Planctomycetes bacterium]|nr:hypothetical protein [Planctomycetota bacterium]